MQKRISLTLLGQAKERFEQFVSAASKQGMEGKENSPEKQLLKSIKQKSELLKINPASGRQIPRSVFPKGLDVPCLFKINLCGYYRMVYTLNINEEEIAVFVLWILSHPEYDKLFGYRKR